MRLQKASKYLREGASIAPTRRNLYYAGVNAYQMGEYEKAKSFFSRALNAPPCKVTLPLARIGIGIFLLLRQGVLVLSQEGQCKVCHES